MTTVSDSEIPTPEEIIALLMELGYQADHLLMLSNLDLLSIWEDMAGEVELAEGNTLNSIIASLEALGLDTSAQYERIQSIINIFVGTDSWDADIAEALMLAMADGMITDAEIEVIFGLQTVKDTVDEQTDEAEDEAEDAVTGGSGASAEVRMQWGAVGVGVNLGPLYEIFGQLTYEVGVRLEAWTANALGIERKD